MRAEVSKINKGKFKMLRYKCLQIRIWMLDLVTQKCPFKEKNKYFCVIVELILLT